MIINKLFQYFDSEFSTHKVHIDEWGSYGAHYQGLTFDTYFGDSVFSMDYLTIEDYFDVKANMKYIDDLLILQYQNEKSESRLRIVEEILNLLYKSNHKKEDSKILMEKTINYLKRHGIFVELESDYYIIKSELIKFRSTFCDIIEVDLIYKKRERS